jgi:hypothetical protein
VASSDSNGSSGLGGLRAGNKKKMLFLQEIEEMDKEEQESPGFKIQLKNKSLSTQQKLAFLVKHKYFSVFIIACIVANTLCLAMDRHPISKVEYMILEYVNLVLSTVFFIEMFLKMKGLGLEVYFKDKFNTFDCFIVFTSTVDFIVVYTMSSGGGGGGAISALRAFRLMRVFKLAKSWRKL